MVSHSAGPGETQVPERARKRDRVVLPVARSSSVPEKPGSLGPWPRTPARAHQNHCARFDEGTSQARGKGAGGALQALEGGGHSQMGLPGTFCRPPSRQPIPFPCGGPWGLRWASQLHPLGTRPSTHRGQMSSEGMTLDTQVQPHPRGPWTGRLTPASGVSPEGTDLWDPTGGSGLPMELEGGQHPLLGDGGPWGWVQLGPWGPSLDCPDSGRQDHRG